MIVRIFYRENTENARTVVEFLRDFEYQTGHQLEVVNPDSIEGAQLCEIYSIVEFPTIIATSDDGQMNKAWNGLPLPTINELSFYTQGQ